jgi:metal-responsive CopG/Arc/MetJ family transcriptional regulator
MEFTVHNIPNKLIEEFDREVVDKLYPGGRSEAIRDLMRKAINKAKKVD